ncbi:TPA: pilus assembly protein [Burkholderia cepacia ATCC 25416]|uniref:pilus assembly protein n=1 Tax=Burkholderia TaxID=32008 RepID=UPI000ADA40E8|nr:pilus assembly protein [Burkholderia cepacia]HDR9765254.1 pilus assembly protein [Burkholderia cepacia ATCC 25416]MCA8028728.1 pilus assembly protein [Burkholderia cepacia]MCA8081484.1 pilus assembly protein [Burkholderia cepacia]HDR9772943.1 pilus assembly protein [Burkholderia cepacia ATCC 25416]HDR9781868.1 pilus assembly protein [Burkholderia cepacia ATCC 25416]
MNLNMRTMLPALCGLLLAAVQPAHAEGELMVLPATTKLFNAHEQKVTVKNMGDAPLYLNVSVRKVTNPGMTPEKKVDLGDLEHPGLLASPDKMTLGPGQTRAIVLKSLVEPEQESIYRLYIVPVRSLKVDEVPKDKITAPMSVAIGYGVLVRHMPPPGKQQSGWTHRCERGGVTLENTGNVREIFNNVTVDKSASPQTIGVFPGVPQHFATKRMTLSADDKPITLECP